jgi:hypothetical protein
VKDAEGGNFLFFRNKTEGKRGQSSWILSQVLFKEKRPSNKRPKKLVSKKDFLFTWVFLYSKIRKKKQERIDRRMRSSGRNEREESVSSLLSSLSLHPRSLYVVHSSWIELRNSFSVSLWLLSRMWTKKTGSKENAIQYTQKFYEASEEHE